METVYFKSTPEAATTLYEEWLKTQSGIEKQKRGIEKRLKADGLYMLGDRISGFIVKGHGHERRGFNSKDITENDIKYSVFTPIGNFKEGKTFNKEVSAYMMVRRGVTNFSNFAAGKYKVRRSLVGSHRGSVTNRALFQSVAGISHGVLVMSVPCNEDNPAPDIDGLTAIKKSEFVALTEE